jgi:hypothetical protein
MKLQFKLGANYADWNVAIIRVKVDKVRRKSYPSVLAILHRWHNN